MNIRRISGRRKRRNYKIIRWDITEHCNHRCEYCIKSAPSKKKMNSENFNDVIYWINNQLNKDQKYIVQLFGGEPTIHPEFWNISSSINIPFGIYTNLSQSLSFYNDLCNIPNFEYFICSLHLSQEKNIRKFYEKIEKIASFSKINVNVAVFLENKNIQKIENCFLDLSHMLKNRGTVYFNNETTDKSFYNTINLSYFNRYMLPEQFIDIEFDSGDISTISELDASKMHFNLKWFLCECNKFGNYVVDIKGNIFTCVNSPSKYSIYNFDEIDFNQEKKICKNSFCHPYLLEYGIKNNMKKVND